MTNCNVIITRGINKGKRCGEVNTKCKHTASPKICDVCGASFNRSTSYYRHIKLHENKPKIQLKSDEKQIDMNVIIEKLKVLEKQNDDLQSQVNQLKHRKPVNNFNIAVIGSPEDLYKELINQMNGDRETVVRFLTDTCVDGEPLSVFKKLYLDGKSPDDYPVACRDHLHFRYLNTDHKVVDDQGGNNIGKLVSNQLINTLLYAANDNMQKDEFNKDQLKLFQDCAVQISRENLVEQLAVLTKNPDHPFFH